MGFWKKLKKKLKKAVSMKGLRAVLDYGSIFLLAAGIPVPSFLFKAQAVMHAWDGAKGDVEKGIEAVVDTGYGGTKVKELWSWYQSASETRSDPAKLAESGGRLFGRFFGRKASRKPGAVGSAAARVALRSAGRMGGQRTYG